MSFSMKEDLCCSICQDIFRDPVVLFCSHSFCKCCLNNWWQGKIILECPLCKTTSTTSDPPCNLVLKQLCEAFLQRQRNKGPSKPRFPSIPEPEVTCTLHGEKFKLFCVEDKQPLCLVCQHSDEHAGHKLKPIAEVSELQRKELRKTLEPLQEKLKVFKEEQETLDHTAEHVKLQVQQTEGRIKEQFRKLRLFLNKEEKNRIAALRTEESKKIRELHLKIDALNKEIDALSGTIRDTEEMLKAEDASLLQSFKTAVQNIQQRTLLENPKPVSGALIDVAKHLGNLSFNIWNKMKQLVSYTPVVLDPNTANSELILSEDLTSVRCGQKKGVPDNPERFDFFRIVLGSEAFMSGTYSWDVEVGDNTDWFVGVASYGVQRKGKHPSHLWRIGCIDGKYIARSLSDPSTDLSQTRKLSRIRVVLDRNIGKLLFFDLDTNTVIHTFKYSFNEKLFPYFNTSNESPLRILPENLCLKQS
ncbi:nuclear factor 7, ovary-like isoform X1 [Fundulus heteroclitus]|uniref:nuclear factor 7, ovary-like isoform X1 n=2 Tax=Fundulus heteroclitus TaxID=8078 RepID=UPI00165BC2B7|nr:nuclear factor 7, ovary-like isoform X1 [Fundulus heteroclitus]XP_036007677.1 nuclear factor 7, ovary-like isoform X1 [Fundulus heteroclitus]